MFWDVLKGCDPYQAANKVVQACMRACIAHPHDAKVQLQAAYLCLQFSSCVCGGCANQEALRQNRAVETMLSAKQNHPDNVQLQIVTDAIAVCCSTGRGESFMRNSRDVLRTTVHAMTTHADERKFQWAALQVMKWHLCCMRGRRRCLQRAGSLL
jgi:hypothetical protein